jgi:hypothetical protein
LRQPNSGAWRGLARHLPDEEQADVDPAFTDNPNALRELLLNERDQLIVRALHSIHQERCADPILVGVVYGAAHMRAVVDALWKFGYRPGDAEWLTVFDVDPPALPKD